MDWRPELEFSSRGAAEFAEKKGWAKSGIDVESSRGGVAMGMQREMAKATPKGAMPYYKSWRCASEMLADRGYHIDEGFFNISYDRFLTQFALQAEGVPSQADLNQLAITASRSRSEGQDDERVLVMFFAAESTVTIDTLRRICSSMKEEGALPDRLIIIAHKTVLPPIHRQVIEAVCPIKVETFHVSQLSTNLVRRLLQKKFHALTSEDKEEIFLGSTEVEITALASDDWISQYYSLDRGTILGVDSMLDLPTHRLFGQRDLFSSNACTRSFILLAEIGCNGVVGQGPYYQKAIFDRTGKSSCQSDLESESGLAYPYFLAWITVVGMLYDRGYTVADPRASPKRLESMEYEEFLRDYGLPKGRSRGLYQSLLDRIVMKATHKDKVDDMAVVTFRGPRETVDLLVVQQLYRQWRDERPKRLIIVMQGVKLSSKDLFLIRNVCPITVEFFHMNDLWGTGGIRGYSYETLSMEEKEVLFFKDFKFKYITPDDDVTRYLGVEEGELLKRVRNVGESFPLNGGKKKKLKKGGPEYVVGYTEHSTTAS